jgi:EthD domain
VFTVLSWLVKRAELGAEEFVDYYENHHVPLILSLSPAPAVYKRHYVVRGDDANIAEPLLDFDVVTEVGFADRESFDAWITSLGQGDAGARVAADEQRFLERSRTRACVVLDQVTTG